MASRFSPRAIYTLYNEGIKFLIEKGTKMAIEKWDAIVMIYGDDNFYNNRSDKFFEEIDENPIDEVETFMKRRNW